MFSRNSILAAAGALLLLVLVLGISCKGTAKDPNSGTDISLESITQDLQALQVKLTEDVKDARSLTIGLFALALVLNVLTIGGVLYLLKKQHMGASAKQAEKPAKPAPAKKPVRKTVKPKTV